MSVHPGWYLTAEQKHRQDNGNGFDAFLWQLASLEDCEIFWNMLEIKSEKIKSHDSPV